MSCGLIVLISPSIPSINIKGDPLDPSPIVPVPRIFIFMFLSSDPLLVDICNPGTSPCNACVALLTGRESSSLAVAIPTDPVRFTFSVSQIRLLQHHLALYCLQPMKCLLLIDFRQILLLLYIPDMKRIRQHEKRHLI